MKHHCLLGLFAVILALPTSGEEAAANAGFTILTTDRSIHLPALSSESDVNEPHALKEDGALWVPASSLEAINGFALKPQGLCCAEKCIPLPKGDSELRRETGFGSLVNLTALAKMLQQPMVHDDAGQVYSLGPIPELQGKSYREAIAPDFALPDRQGNLVRLSDFRGKKVLLLTWASWCGCSLDLPGWQAVYEELKDQGFELIAVAQDTEGESAAGKFYDRANATFTTLIDSKHVVSSLYQMVNVPAGVWIDETGKIVRPAEVAYSKTFNVLGQEIGDDRYVPALRDWVAKGKDSEHVMSPQQLAKSLTPRDEELQQADAYFKLGVHFYEMGNVAEADKYWQKAQKLNPDNWNYHRQQWTFHGSDKIVKWMQKVRGLQGKPYYDPIDWGRPD